MKRIIDRSIDLGELIPQADDDMIICRCEEVTKGEIRQAVHDGMLTLTEIRRYLRTGMGFFSYTHLDVYKRQLWGWIQWNNPEERRGIQRRLHYDMLEPVSYTHLGFNKCRLQNDSKK